MDAARAAAGLSLTARLARLFPRRSPPARPPATLDGLCKVTARPPRPCLGW